MKLSAYARSLRISYRTALRWFRAGKIAGFQADTGTIIITEPDPLAVPVPVQHKVAIYTRVSAAENGDCGAAATLDNLEGQANLSEITVQPKATW